MSLTATEISLVVDELAPALTGGWIQKVFQPTPRSIVLEVRAPGHTHRLLLSAHPSASRLHLVTQPLQNPPTPPGFCQYLRAHLQGARIDHVRQEAGDRIVSIGLTSKEGPVRLIAALTGHKANLLVLDAESRVLKDLNHSTDLYGQPYQLPSAPMASGHRQHEARFKPVEQSVFSVSAAIESCYHEKESTDAFAALKEARAHHLKKAIKKQRRRIDAWHADLAKADKYRDYARYGELLKANLGTIKKGQETVTVVDYFDEALPQVSIPLDPTKSAQGNMDDYFRKQRKYDTAQRELGPRIAQGEQEFDALRRELTSIEQGTWQPAASPNPSPSRRQGQPVMSHQPSAKSGPFRRFTSSDGLPIFVGRNARENDELTFGLAKSEDLWLHARGTPGSHVVVRLEKGAEVPPESLRDAATLALLYSDLKKSGKGDVIYTKRKWVKKAKGQTAGAVTVTQDKSIFVSLDRHRLEQLKTRSA
ncbi:Rqc2 family fibronectin-binding protein [Nitrospira sp. NS4]|uniref:Rqc2 family fibronectin-binding protein n=1 Tax=Nitrospira sp. NS4 TaxID=3414498 RepID=UPI003C2FEFE5